MHRHPEALELALRGILDLMEPDDVAYLVNAVRTNAEKRTRFEMRQHQGYGESWSDLTRLFCRLLTRGLGG